MGADLKTVRLLSVRERNRSGAFVGLFLIITLPLDTTDSFLLHLLSSAGVEKIESMSGVCNGAN